MGLVVGVGGKKVPVGNVSMCPAAACRPVQTDLGLVCCVTGAGERFRPGSKLFIHIKTKHKKLPLWLIPSSSLGRKSPFVAGKRKTLLIRQQTAPGVSAARHGLCFHPPVESSSGAEDRKPGYPQEGAREDRKLPLPFVLNLTITTGAGACMMSPLAGPREAPALGPCCRRVG